MSINKRFVALLIVIVAFSAVAQSTAQAQQGPGAEILQGLLRDLLQSKVDRRNEPRRELKHHPLLVPGERSAQQRAPDRVPAVVIKAGGFYASFAKESQQLVRLLRADARKVPGIGSQLGNILQLQTRAQLMSDKFATPQKEDFILGNISALDRDWRSAAYQLNQLPGLAAACAQSIGRLDRLNEQSCALFDIQPQINRRELIRLADSFGAEIHHLERDVESELRGRPRAQRLIMQLRRAEAKANLLSDSIADGDSLDIIVPVYKQLLAEWNKLGNTLEAFNNRHIDRTVEEIHEVNRKIQERLWLPIGVDREHIKHLAFSIRDQTKALGDTFSLTMLTELPDSVTVLKAAQGLNTETAHLCAEIETNGSTDDLVTHWTELDAAWQAFDRHTAPIDSPRINNLRQQVSRNVDAMRQALGIRLVFDRREVIRIVAELEGIAEQAQYHVGQWQRRPGASLEAGLIRAAKKMITDVNHLHKEAVGSASREHLARDCQKLTQNWSQLRPMLMACRTADQRTLRRIADDATAKLIHLQTLLQP